MDADQKVGIRPADPIIQKILPCNPRKDYQQLAAAGLTEAQNDCGACVRREFVPQWVTKQELRNPMGFGEQEFDDE